ncbi:MAG: patatin-like phospholipase family protein [Bacteriovoracia bacterium]
MSRKLGLVMTGGGARAAFQVGVVRALYEILGKKNNLFDVISGNSAGAINSTYLAANCENWDVATHNLTELWSRVKPQNIYDLRKRTISDLGLKWVSGTVLGGLTPKGSSVNHLLDTAPLKSLAEKEVDFSHISKNISEKFLHAVSLSVTSYNTGSSVIYYECEDSIKDWTRSDRFSCKTKLQVEHLMASASIPFFFPPVKIGDSFYGDGCIRQTTPLSPAIHLGAKKLIAVGVRHSRDISSISAQTFSPFPDPTMGQVAGVMLNAIFLDSLDADVERLKRINELVSEGAHPELKTIPILLIRPSRDLGKMTSDISSELPAILRYLLKGIGVSGQEGLDLLSYLAFDPSYTKPLIELGYEDTYKMKDEILKFNDVF